MPGRNEHHSTGKTLMHILQALQKSHPILFFDPQRDIWFPPEEINEIQLTAKKRLILKN